MKAYMTWPEAEDAMLAGKQVRRDCWMKQCSIHIGDNKKRVWQDGRTYRTSRFDRGAKDWQVVE